MHSSTLSLLRLGIQQTEQSIAQRRRLLAEVDDASVASRLEDSIRKLDEILNMHLRTERALSRNQQIARVLRHDSDGRGEALNDEQLDRLCDEAMAEGLTSVPASPTSARRV